ncbi:hypothetical protein ALQ04_200050 [Pseudomonas cichorii]|uniref:Uncharacterized protein n=1 Tax=Pseudomonas cichorii TaxID=36746 RepID=A0A3M4LJ15_PSECI|nr:hypothetical protein ALQ04_200050 [Pseudomonas cichorii]
MGIFDLESFGLARCFLKAHGVQVSQRLRNAMSSSRLVRPGLFTLQLSYHYVL